MREFSGPGPDDRNARGSGLDRRDGWERSHRQHVTGLAARLADAIRTDDRDALDRAQRALHELDREVF